MNLTSLISVNLRKSADICFDAFSITLIIFYWLKSFWGFNQRYRIKCSRCLRGSRLKILGILVFLVFLSCVRQDVETENITERSAELSGETSVNAAAGITWQGAQPTAILKAGEYPLWFQLTQDGPVHIEAIEDAMYTSALIPWPYALHINFLQEAGGELVMIVNRDGFLKLSPHIIDNNIHEESSDLALFRFSGGDFFRQYTAGGFTFYEDNPVVFLYLDTRFINSELLQPRPRTWTFNMDSNDVFPVIIPALQFISEDDGWGIDTLRFGTDGLIYYRAVRRNNQRTETRMFRTPDLSQSGDEISSGVFLNSTPRSIDIFHPSLPPLPEGFFYTGIVNIGDNLFASWEEQTDYSIGAAGFILILEIK